MYLCHELCMMSDNETSRMKRMVEEHKMNIIFLDYGNNTANQMQTYFSVISLMAWADCRPRILVLAEHAEAYRHLSGIVEVIELNQRMLKEWRGAHDYSFRIKICAIQHAVRSVQAREEGAAFMFVDSDTFAFHQLDSLFEEVVKGHPCMHKNEGMPYQTRGASRRLWKVVKGKCYAGVQIGEDSEMWNSGVIGMPAAQAEDVCELALRLCDEMLADGVRSFNVEQFCFSVALRHVCGDIQSAEPYICHYWGNKDGWCQRIEEFLVRSYMEEHSLEEDLQCLRDMDMTATPYYVRTPIWRKRLLRWVDAVAPLKKPECLR